MYGFIGMSAKLFGDVFLNGENVEGRQRERLMKLLSFCQFLSF